MNCRDTQTRFDERLDDHLPAPERAAFDAHLAGCPACRQQWQAYAAAWDTLARQSAPDPSWGFADRVLRRLDEPEPAERPWFDQPIWRRLVASGVALTVVVGVTLLMTYRIVQKSRHAELYSQVQSADYLDDLDVIASLDQLEGGNQL